MTTLGQSVQEMFLNKICESKTPVTVYLVCGVKLQGIITGTDAESFLLRRDAYTQLVYKHAVSTVMPASPVEGL